MAYSHVKAMLILKKELSKNFSKLTFDYETDKDFSKASARGVTLGKLDDDVLLMFDLRKNGRVTFRVVFDKIDESPATLALVNKFNRENLYFCAFIRSDGFLEFANSTIYSKEKEVSGHATFFMNRFLDLIDDDTIKALSACTHA